MSKGAPEVYKKAIIKLGAFTEGEFDHFNFFTQQPQGRLSIRTAYIESPDNPFPTVPQAMVYMTDSSRDKPTVQYTLDPRNLSRVGRFEVGAAKQAATFLGRFFPGQARFVASQSDLRRLLKIVKNSTPTAKFDERIQAHKLELKQREADLRWERDEVEGRRQARLRSEATRAIYDQRMTEAETKAAPILENVRRIPGAKCLGIIFDDNSLKAGKLRDQYSRIKDRVDFQMIFEWAKYGLEALDLIVAVQKLNTGKDQIPVVVFMDGSFPPETDFRSGVDATCELNKALEELGLPMPNLVGNAVDFLDDTVLQQRFPGIYLGATFNGTKTLEPWREIGDMIKSRSA